MKLNELIANNTCVVFGFPAFKQLAEYSNPGGVEISVISTDSPGKMLERGYGTYWAVVLPERAQYRTVQEIIGADLEAIRVKVAVADPLTKDSNVLIVSHNPDTADRIKSLYPEYIGVCCHASKRLLQCEDVVGALPIKMVQHCHSYSAAIIESYDRAVDGVVQGGEVVRRLVILPPVRVEVLDE
jgi:hypothetical protein